VWPEGLAHYVRRHPVALPSEFIEDATLKTGSINPSPSPSAQRREVDDSFWISWARSYRIDAVEVLLQGAVAAASRACEAKLDAAALERTRVEGIGTSSCTTGGCDRRVLGGTVFCARCLAERDRDRLAFDAELAELKRVTDRFPGLLPNPALQSDGRVGRYAPSRVRR
jgi:hypothetical protein